MPRIPRKPKRADEVNHYQLQGLRNYLGNFFPEALTRRGPTPELTSSAIIELLDQLREFQRERAANQREAQAALDKSRGNALKGAVVRLVRGGIEKLSPEDLKKQAVEMIADAKFWHTLTTLEYAQEEMTRLLGPYA